MDPHISPHKQPSENLEIPHEMKENSGWANTQAEGETYQYSPSGQTTIAMINQGLEDNRCTQIDGYGPGRFSAQYEGQNMLLEGASFASEEEYLYWLENVVRSSRSIVTWEGIQRDRMGVLDLPSGARLSVFMPPVSRRYPTFSLRKHRSQAWPSGELVAGGLLDTRMMLFLQSCIAAHMNMLFVGGMGSGKTTLMRSLLQGIGDNERVAVVEQTPEIALDKPLVNEYIYYPTLNGLGLDEILDYNLYNGLDRLIVGEIHLEGLSKMLETMILTEGSMSTYHAYSTEQAGERMKIGLQLEHNNVSAQTAISYIRQAVELIVVLQKTEKGRRVTQITEIDWRTSSGREILAGGDLFIYNQEQDQFFAKNAPHLGRIEKKLEKYGVPIRGEWFIEQSEIERFQRLAR